MILRPNEGFLSKLFIKKILRIFQKKKHKTKYDAQTSISISHQPPSPHILRDVAQARIEALGDQSVGHMSQSGHPSLTYVDIIDQIVVEWFQNLDFDFQELAFLG